MATVNFHLKSNKAPATVYTRFRSGREVDITSGKIPLSVDPAFWSLKKRRYKDSTSVIERDLVNEKLDKLESTIKAHYNASRAKNEEVSKKWLDSIINEFFNLQKGDKEWHYVTDFMEYYITNFAPHRINQRTGRNITDGTIRQLRSARSTLRSYEIHKGIKLKFKDIDLIFRDGYVKFMKHDLKLSQNTINSKIKRLRTLIRKARNEGYEINEDINNPDFMVPEQKAVSTYLNEEEIRKLFDYDFSNNERLENARDWLIIGVNTGLRVKDLLDLNDLSIDILEITVSKTQNVLMLPIHPMIKELMKRRRGVMPRKITPERFNEYIKEVCREVGIVEQIEGTLMNPKTGRKEKGMFPKYKLVSSHICRRSFATNHYGKLPTDTIMAVTNHKSESQFLKYLKVTSKEHAKRMAYYWENKPSV